MKNSALIWGIVAIVGVAALAGAARSQQVTRRNDALIFASPGKAKFKEVIPGVSKAILWGDPDTGPYGAFTRFKTGYDASTHTHTNDVWIVGISGAYLYRDDDGEKRVAAGNFIRIPGGKKHWSGGDPKEGALFYEESSGKFDLVPAK